MTGEREGSISCGKALVIRRAIMARSLEINKVLAYRMKAQLSVRGGR